jgi:hypothetical protein
MLKLYVLPLEETTEVFSSESSFRPRSNVSGLGTGLDGIPSGAWDANESEHLRYIAPAKKYGKPRAKNIAVLITQYTAPAKLLIYQCRQS